MSYVQLYRGVFRWFTPLTCGPGYPELSQSYLDMARNCELLFTSTFYTTCDLQIKHDFENHTHMQLHHRRGRSQARQRGVLQCL